MPRAFKGFRWNIVGLPEGGTGARASGTGADAQAVAYVEIETPEGALFGVGEHVNIVTASLRAVTSAVNRAIRMGRGVRTEGSDTRAA